MFRKCSGACAKLTWEEMLWSWMEKRATHKIHKTGQKMRVECEGDQCLVYLWAPSTKEIIKDESEKVLKGNRYAVLAVGDEGEGDFSRRAKQP